MWILIAFLRILWCARCANNIRHSIKNKYTSTLECIILHHAVIMSVVMMTAWLTASEYLIWWTQTNLLSGFMLGFAVIQNHNGELVTYHIFELSD